ncbi:hypothetical protein RJ640_019320 [Escallonia rubra]|uniref:Uncharacterized protein n=1 Tax=Escallonia rubra TaxID=112253 RepID=A0AA88RMS7_9ASTE|nr:hypothetical protein RJ640_019320 [Escallonia rubra]
MPYPGRGHINPMINLCTLLASRDSITITIVLTEEWLGLVGSGLDRPNIRLWSIPNVLPSEHDRVADIIGFIESVFTKMEAPFCRLLDQLDDLPVSCVLADTLLPWITAVGSRRSIPTVSLWTAVPSTFLGLYEEFPGESLIFYQVVWLCSLASCLGLDRSLAEFSFHHPHRLVKILIETKNHRDHGNTAYRNEEP